MNININKKNCYLISSIKLENLGESRTDKHIFLGKSSSKWQNLILIVAGWQLVQSACLTSLSQSITWQSGSWPPCSLQYIQNTSHYMRCSGFLFFFTPENWHILVACKTLKDLYRRNRPVSSFHQLREVQAIHDLDMLGEAPPLKGTLCPQLESSYHHSLSCTRNSDCFKVNKPNKSLMPLSYKFHQLVSAS